MRRCPLISPRVAAPARVGTWSFGTTQPKPAFGTSVTRFPMSRSAASIPAVLLLLALSACRAAQEDMASEPLGDGAVVAMFPADGARELISDIPIEVVLGADAVGVVPKIELDVDG